MKIYEDRLAPNPRRVRIFLAEKGVDAEYLQVDIGKGEHRTPEFREKSPLALLPVLELPDGGYLSETMAICRYIEELHPEPSLFGTTALERADIEMWNRRMEFEIFWPIAFVFRNTHAYFRDVLPQVPEFGEVSRQHAFDRLAWLNEVLESRQYIAGDRFSVADITALCGLDFGRITGTTIQDEHRELKRWHASVSARPSAGA